MNALLEGLHSQSAEFVAIRRDIHRHPELGFEEHRTSELVAESLAGWGYAVERKLGGTGVVGQLRKGSGIRTLGLRADMDALPVQEQTGLPHQSCHAGVMHACGHDGHTTMLLAAARYLSEQADFDGTLNLVFQPAEEGLGGARRMMEDGLFEKYPCDAIFAMHNMPGHAQGRLVLRDGPFMASSDYVTITLKGIGGHGAMPHLAADPVVAAAGIVIALQSIVSRNIDPQQTAVITVGALHAGSANNVIPQGATLELSVRALDRSVRQALETRIRDLVHAQAQSYGVTADIAYRRGYPVLVNTPAETDFARRVALDLLGEDKVTTQGEPLTGSEDFAFMLERVPGSYLLIGNGDGHSAGACMVHNPKYDFNDANLPIGAAYWVALAQAWLA
nr:M20 aminoacylase family protein [uncultured Noviherbaspirillum sp.]